HIFNEPGIYSYFCSPHPWMTGFVIVDDQDANKQDVDEEDLKDDEEDPKDDEEEQNEYDEDEDDE
ncbi:MAG: cupredoxin domain-containing protein, partial [Nitrososphaeraceae archaeon]